MKTFLTTTALIGALAVATPSHAFFDSLFGDGCTGKAANLVQVHGPKVTSAYAKVQAAGIGAISADDLKVSEDELAELKDYVESGCAKEHLTTALEAAAEAVKSGAAAEAAKGLF